MRRPPLIWLPALLLLPLLAGSAFAQTVDEVVEKHLAAVGGREALAKLTSRTSTGTVTVSTAAAELPGTVEIYSKLPNKTRVVIRLDLGVVGGTGVVTIMQLFDGTKGWAMNSLQGDSEISGRQLENLRNNTFPTPLLSYKSGGSAFELLPRERINGRDAVVMRSTRAESGTRIYLDADTYLVMRTVTTIDSPGGPLEQTSDLSDYRTADGMRVPFHIVNSNPLQTVSITLNKIEHNLAIDDAMFVKK